MKLLTKEVIKRLEKFPLRSQDGKGLDAEIVVKFFNPAGRFTFFVTDAERQEDDWYFFGYCLSSLGEDCDEFGPIMLSEIATARSKAPFRLPFERDMHIRPGTTIREELRMLGVEK